MMITCKSVYDSASDYVEGPVSLRRRLQFYLHLVICKHCRRYLRQISLAMGVASVVPPMETPTDAEVDTLAKRLMEAGSNR